MISEQDENNFHKDVVGFLRKIKTPSFLIPTNFTFPESQKFYSFCFNIKAEGSYCENENFINDTSAVNFAHEVVNRNFQNNFQEFDEFVHTLCDYPIYLWKTLPLIKEHEGSMKLFFRLRVIKGSLNQDELYNLMTAYEKI